MSFRLPLNVKKILLIGQIIGVVWSGVNAAEFYAAPSGSANGDGSRSQPWDLQTALNHPSPVLAGDTIWLKGGIYEGKFISQLNGVKGEPIVVRAVPGERVTLDGGNTAESIEGVHSILLVAGEYTWFWGFEITSSVTDRTTPSVRESPKRGSAIKILDNAGEGGGNGTKFINLIVHDADQGMSYWESAENSEVYGCLFFNNGWQIEGRGSGTGHGIYAQNRSGERVISDNVFFGSLSGYGLHAYGSSAAALSGFRVIGNVHVECQLLLGGKASVENARVRENYSWGATTSLGWHGGDGTTVNRDLVAERNYLVSLGHGALWTLGVYKWRDATVRSNTVVSRPLVPRFTKHRGIMHLRRAQGGGVLQGAYNIDRNRYYGVESAFGTSLADKSDLIAYEFGEWQRAIGVDDDSIFRGSLPSENRVFVRPNKYEEGRAHVIVYNWEGASSVKIDLSGIGLKEGDLYEVRDALNYFGGSIASGVYKEGPISVPMKGLELGRYVGNVSVEREHPAPHFGVFVVERSGGEMEEPPPVKEPVENKPTLTEIPDQMVGMGESSGVIEFEVLDDQVDPSKLVVSAVSSNPSLIGPSGLVLEGEGSRRSLVVEPRAGEVGTCIIGIFVYNGTEYGGRSFRVTVVKGMEGNEAPMVFAGEDLFFERLGGVELHGAVTDDGLPNPPGRVVVEWKHVCGPGDVVFDDPNAVNTTAWFTTAGSYWLRMTADDGLSEASDDIEVRLLPGMGENDEVVLKLNAWGVNDNGEGGLYGFGPRNSDIMIQSSGRMGTGWEDYRSVKSNSEGFFEIRLPSTLGGRTRFFRAVQRGPTSVLPK